MAGYPIADVNVKDAAGSEEYRPAKEIRLRTAISRAPIVEGARD